MSVVARPDLELSDFSIAFRTPAVRLESPYSLTSRIYAGGVGIFQGTAGWACRGRQPHGLPQRRPAPAGLPPVAAGLRQRSAPAPPCGLEPDSAPADHGIGFKRRTGPVRPNRVDRAGGQRHDGAPGGRHDHPRAQALPDSRDFREQLLTPAERAAAEQHHRSDPAHLPGAAGRERRGRPGPATSLQRMFTSGPNWSTPPFRRESWQH